MQRTRRGEGLPAGGATMIDGYSGFTPIGHGGFSTVYLAHQEIFDRQVAVKVLHANLSDADAQRRFVRECRATGRLTGHPHVVTVFDAGATRDSRPYLTMEYFSAGSLAGRLKASGPIDVATVVTTGIAVADALDAAHRADILHRDLKPANILLRTPSHPVLSDFGIASVAFGPDVDADTVSAAFTPGYAAPEVLLGEEPSVAADVFALGATLFSLLRGTPPYPGRAPAQVLNRILEHGPEPLGRDDVPPALADLLTRMLDRDSTRRPVSAAEVTDQLRALALPVDVEPTASRPARQHRPVPPLADAAAAAELLTHPAPRTPTPANEPTSTHPGMRGPNPAAPAMPTPVPNPVPNSVPNSVPPTPTRRSRRRIAAWVPVTAVAALAVLIGGILLLLRPDGGGTGNDPVTGPDAQVTVGLDDAAMAAAEKRGFGSPTAEAGVTPGATPTTAAPPTAGLSATAASGALGGQGQPGVGTSAGPQPLPGGSVASTVNPPGATAAPPAPPAPPATQAPAGPGCSARAEAITDYAGRRHANRYYCSTYVSYGVYSNVSSGQAGEGLDDSGWMYAASSVWVICQVQGRSNPVVQGNTNTWWLYTQGDESRGNTHGYSAGWGYLPATVVTVGGQNEPIPGVPTCGSYL